MPNDCAAADTLARHIFELLNVIECHSVVYTLDNPFLVDTTRMNWIKF